MFPISMCDICLNGLSLFYAQIDFRYADEIFGCFLGYGLKRKRVRASRGGTYKYFNFTFRSKTLFENITLFLNVFKNIGKKRVEFIIKNMKTIHPFPHHLTQYIRCKYCAQRFFRVIEHFFFLLHFFHLLSYHHHHFV